VELTLAQVTGAGRVLSPAQIVALLEGVAAELDHLHAGGVTYGVLTPAAIWIGSDGRVALVDPRAAAADPNRTVAYLSPEQRHAADDEVPGPATDQYALALIAYELFTGEAREARVNEAGELSLITEVDVGPGAR
jgi:serine/threonine protein kinase